LFLICPINSALCSYLTVWPLGADFQKLEQFILLNFRRLLIFVQSKISLY
jgi:hypothetical protein